MLVLPLVLTDKNENPVVFSSIASAIGSLILSSTSVGVYFLEVPGANF